jgi:hypothetical protein
MFKSAVYRAIQVGVLFLVTSAGAVALWLYSVSCRTRRA